MTPGRRDVLAFAGAGCAAALLAACKPASPPQVDGGDAAITWTELLSDGGVVVADPALACANLRRVGCAEGSDPSCAHALGQAPALGHTTLLAIACVAGAPNANEARRCDPSYFCR